MGWWLPFSVLVDEDAFSVVAIVFPLSEVDVSVVVLEDAGAVFAVVPKLSLVGFARGVLDFLDVGHELPVGSVDVLFEEGLNDAPFLFQQLRRVARLLHYNSYIRYTCTSIINLIRKTVTTYNCCPRTSSSPTTGLSPPAQTNTPCKSGTRNASARS